MSKLILIVVLAVATSTLVQPLEQGEAYQVKDGHGEIILGAIGKHSSKEIPQFFRSGKTTSRDTCVTIVDGNDGCVSSASECNFACSVVEGGWTHYAWIPPCDCLCCKA